MTSVSPQEAVRKKQLGQYFTGQRVGRLLAALAGAKTARSIIDPMVGSGDLLASCLAVGAVPEKLVGLEIDPVAFAQAKAAFSDVPGADLSLANAFAAELPAEQFDLVITNPPYIRYQSRGKVDGVDVPSSQAVRDGLVRAIKSRSGISNIARARLLHAAVSYPGTADIAVPAWILSASLVRDGGTLAVVAPQAWLSRNYAHVVRELIDDMFQMDVIVEDGDASWFADAQVRTHLVVARRRMTGLRPSAGSVVVAQATVELATKGRLLGALRSEYAVAAALRKVRSEQSVDITTGLTAHVQNNHLAAAPAGHVPARVASLLGVSPENIPTRTLDSYGWRAGQGLRTGANDFFYVSDQDGKIRPAARWGIESLDIPAECLLPAVRRQSQLGDTLSIHAGMVPPSRIVNLRGWVTATDKKRMNVKSEIKVLPSSVARWIAQVAASPLSGNHPEKLFPSLAAVTTNIKTDSSGQPVAFWYQLPELAPRHRPALFLGRVCGGQPTAYANTAGAVIDANFSTLWPVGPDALPVDALIALLHSSWVWASLESTCTVLGGGALKVEATDLRRLALPDLGARDIARLGRLGRSLLKRRRDDVEDIDDAIAAALAPSASGCTNQAGGLRALGQRSLERRSRR